MRAPRRIGTFKIALVALLLALFATSPARYVAADGPNEREVSQIAENLACPICEGQSVAESSSKLAGEMRDVIRKKVEAGESRDAIIEYFVDRYGEGILLAPPKSGFNQILWWLPSLGLLLGVGLSAVVLLRWKAARAKQPPSDSGSAAISGEERERYERRLQRELESDF